MAFTYIFPPCLPFIFTFTFTFPHIHACTYYLLEFTAFALLLASCFLLLASRSSVPTASSRQMEIAFTPAIILILALPPVPGNSLPEPHMHTRLLAFACLCFSRVCVCMYVCMCVCVCVCVCLAFPLYCTEYGRYPLFHSHPLTPSTLLPSSTPRPSKKGLLPLYY